MWIKAVWLVSTMLVLVASSASAAAISKLPFTIKKPGQYTLLKNMRYSGTGAAITVACNDVIIDLRGFSLDGDPDKMSTNETAAIQAVDRKNVTIRNGTIRSFFRGIYFDGVAASSNHLVENMRVDSCAFLGIQIKGQFSVVRDNCVTHIASGSTISSFRYGIFVEGNSIHVLRNQVQDIQPTSGGTVYCIFAVNAPNCMVEGNRVQQLINNTLNVFGIYLEVSSASLVLANRISSTGGGVVFSNSIQCKYRDNITANVTSPYTGSATDAGDND